MVEFNEDGLRGKALVRYVINWIIGDPAIYNQTHWISIREVNATGECRTTHCFYGWLAYFARIPLPDMVGVPTHVYHKWINKIEDVAGMTDEDRALRLYGQYVEWRTIYRWAHMFVNGRVWHSPDTLTPAESPPL